MITENFAYVLRDAILGLGIGAIVITALASLILLILVIVGRVKLFKKCNKEGWKAIIPFYTDYVFLVEICGLHWAWFLATLLIDLSIVTTSGLTSILKVFVSAMAFYNLALRGQKDTIPAMIFGGILSSIMTVVYGLGDYVYHGDIEVKSSGLF